MNGNPVDFALLLSIGSLRIRGQVQVDPRLFAKNRYFYQQVSYLFLGKLNGLPVR